MTPQQFAREELDRYLDMMGVTNADVTLSVDTDAGLSDEGYEWKQHDGGIALTAGGDLGLLFGVYALLRDLGGCRFSGLGEDGEYVPQRDALDPITAPVRREPKLWYRGMQFSSIYPAAMYHQQLDWMVKNGFNYLTVMLAPDAILEHIEIDPATGEPVAGGDVSKFRITQQWYDEHLRQEVEKRALKVDINHHNLRFWLPPAKYLDKHPEWYALSDGKRGANLSQLCICTSNDEAVNTLIENVKAYLRAHRDIKLLGVIPEDGCNCCQCENCQAMDLVEDDYHPRDYRDPEDEHRNLSNRYGRLLNQVARAVKDEFPDVLIGAAAYVDLQWPPRDVELEDNIFVWLATYWRDGVRPITKDSPARINRIYYDLARQWREKLAAPTIIYAYYMGMNAQRGLPYPMVRPILGDWKTWKNLGVEGATVQMLVSCHDAYGFNLAAFAESAWHDQVDFDQLLKDYLLGMFGAAASAIRPIYEGFEKAVDAVNAHEPQSTMPGKPEETWFVQPTGDHAYFFARYLPDVDAALDQARSLAKTDREKRQVEAFAQYMGYFDLAAKAETEADMRGVIDYLNSMPHNGWFAASAVNKWQSAIKRLNA